MWDEKPNVPNLDSMAAPQFHLQAFGPVEILVHGASVSLRNDKARAILVYLCLGSDGPLLRSELCDLLWPEKDPLRARASFRQCLASIRRAIGPLTDSLLILDGEQIGLARGVMSTDLDALLIQMRSRPFASATLSDCLKVRRMFTDIFSISPTFEEWARETRNDALAAVLRQLKDIYKDTKMEWAVRHACAQTAIKLDEFDEEAVRSLMLTFLENAEPAAALRVYDLFFERLENEMDAEPAPETQELAVAIKLDVAPRQVSVISATSVRVQPNARPITMAVLPFEVFGAEQQGKDLSLALLEHLTCHLASFRAPSVISSNTTRMYLDQVPRPADVGRDLNTRYLLSGSVRLKGDQAALTAQLVEAQTERVVWATTLVSPKHDILMLNVPIAEEIARAIVPSVDAEELHLSRTMPTHELEPYHLVLQAKDLIFRLSHDDFVEAGQLLAIAVQSGPQFAPAHSMMADWLSIRMWEGWSTDKFADRAALDQHARKAIALSPRDGRVMALWAHNRMMFDRDYDGALSLLEDAIYLCPNDAEALAWSVPTLTTTRHADEAVRNGKRALELSPYDPFIFRNEHFLSFALFTQGDYDKSAEYGFSSFRRAPNYSGNIRATIAALMAAGRQAEAAPLVEHHIKINPNFSVAEFEKIQGFRDPVDRGAFATLLLDAGLPA
jgi:DNA-binding SARP family transcriptional activator